MARSRGPPGADGSTLGSATVVEELLPPVASAIKSDKSDDDDDDDEEEGEVLEAPSKSSNPEDEGDDEDSPDRRQLDHEIVLEVTGQDMLILGLRMNFVKRCH